MTIIKAFKLKIKKIIPIHIWNFLRTIRSRIPGFKDFRYLLMLSINTKNRLIYFLFTIPYLEKKDFVKLSDYVIKYPKDVTVLAKENRNYQYSSPNFVNKKNNETTDIRHVLITNVYDIILHNATIIAESNVILLNNDLAIYELKYLDPTSNFYYSADSGIIYYDNDRFLTPRNNQIVNLESGIKLVANYSLNYFHFLNEVISIFFFIERLKIDIRIPILVDESCKEISQFLELINTFNEQNREIIYVKREVNYKIESLYYFGFGNIIVPHYINNAKILAKDNLFDSRVIEFIRTKFLTENTTTEYHKKIYLSRLNSGQRRKFNEDEVLSVMDKYGVVTIYPENYSISEQAQIFNEATHIIGATGAAFTNVLFCNKNCKILCFTNFDIPISVFPTLAQSVGADIKYIYDETKIVHKYTNLHESFTVDIKLLEVFLSNWIID